MIESSVQIMLYVKDTKKAKDFWCDKMGFVLVDSFNDIGDVSYVVSPSIYSDVRFVIHNKEIIEKLSPEISTNCPSILLNTSNLEQTFEILRNKNVNINPIQDVGKFFVCNFSDEEGNYFAIKQDK